VFITQQLTSQTVSHPWLILLPVIFFKLQLLLKVTCMEQSIQIILGMLNEVHRDDSLHSIDVTIDEKLNGLILI
jgi:hypothetical protein